MSSGSADRRRRAGATAVPAGVRRERVLRLLGQQDHVRVAELSRAFDVSEVTVRADLDALAADGRLRRVRGGAVPVAGAERPLEQTETAQAGEKQAIGAAAAAMVTDGATVILDVGSTTTAIARALATRTDLRDVVVFTNGLTIALALESAAPRITVVVTGGTLRPLQHSLVNPLGELVFERITAQLLFLGCNGVATQGGVTNVNLPEAEVKRRMLRAAHRRVVVADGSKVGRVALAHLCAIGDVDLLLTGASADPDTLAALGEAGLAVDVVGART